jgi:COMPASS component SWD2
MSEDDHMLTLHLSGKQKKHLRCRQHGIKHIIYTHHRHCVLCSSLKPEGRHEIRYWSLYDNQYLRVFSAHSQEVTSLSMCPSNDNFLSASLDRTVRLWDLSTPQCVAALQLPQDCERPFAAYDPSAMVFGVMCERTSDRSNLMKLFDVRNYSTGPFATFSISPTSIATSFLGLYPEATEEKILRIAQVCVYSVRTDATHCTTSQASWTDMQFSPDGKFILVNTDSELVVCIDSFEGTMQNMFADRVNENRSSLGVCWTPNSMDVISGKPR